MSTLPFLSPVAAYSGKVRGGTERVLGVHPGRNIRDGDTFSGRRGTEGGVVGCLGTVERGGHVEKGDGVGGEMGGVSQENDVLPMVDGSNDNSCLSSIGRGDEGLGEGDNTSTNSRKRCLVVEAPKETEAGRNREGGEGMRNERGMGVGVEMKDEHWRCLSSVSLDSNPCVMNPHQNVHMTALRHGGRNFIGNNTPLPMNNHNCQHHYPRCQDIAYYPTSTESGDMVPNMGNSSGGTLRNYSVEEAMGIKRGKTRGDPSIKKDNFVKKFDDERPANVSNGIDSSMLENVPSDMANAENYKKIKLDLKKKLDAAVVLRSLKNMSPSACNEVLQSSSSNKGFTMCMVSESKLRETVKSCLERLEVDTKTEEDINLDGGGETSLSSLGSQQSQDLKFVKNSRPNAPSKRKLKAWLEEHHQNPYPTTRTKLWLSEITGMTVKQVSTWFMNARARMGLVQKMKLPRARDVVVNKGNETYSNVYPNDRPGGLQCHLPTANEYNNPYVEKGRGDKREKRRQHGVGSSTEFLDTNSSGTESSVNGDTVMNHQDDVKREERAGSKESEFSKSEGSRCDEELAEGDIEEGIVDDEQRLEGQNDAEVSVVSPAGFRTRATSSQGSIDTELDFGTEMPEGDTSRLSKRRRINPWERATLERWLCAHLDNPYPTLSEKVELAKRTNMSIKQVNAWGSTLNAVGGDDCVTRQPLISRVWETCKGNARVTPTETIEAHELVVCTFNILADGLSGRQPNRGGFVLTPRYCLDFDYRKNRILSEIRRWQPDILALQEVDHFPDFFAPALEKEGYTCLFVKKPSSPSLQYCEFEDGCCVCFKKNAFTLNASHAFTFSYEEEIMNQVAQLVVLTCNSSGRRLVFATTHLKAEKTPEGEETRRIQAQQLLKEVESLQCCQAATLGVPTAALPIIICGDMNAMPFSSSCEFKYGPHCLKEFMCHSLALRSAFPLDDKDHYTTWKVREKGETKSAIDHVFFCGEGLEPMKRSSCALDQLELSDCLLPGPAYPSDHIALAVKFEIKPFGKKHSDTCSSTT